MICKGKQIYPIDNMPFAIPVGIQTENGAKEIRFDVSSWLDKWPDLQFYVWVKRPTETTAYPAAVQLVGDVLEWYVSDADTDIPGCGTVEVEGSAPGIRVLTGEIPTTIRPTSRASIAEPPDPIKDWHDRLMQAIEDAGGTLYVTATIGEAYSDTLFKCTFDKTGEEVVEAVKAGQFAVCLMPDGEGVNVLPLVSYSDNGRTSYQVHTAAVTITFNQNSDNSGEMRMEMHGAAQEVKPTTPIYVTSADYSVTTCNMTFAEIVACIEAGTLGMPIVWQRGHNSLYRIPLTVQGVVAEPNYITVTNDEGHGLYHNSDDTTGFAYNDGSVPVDNVAFAEQSDGTVMVQGVAFAEQDDGSVLWAGAEFEEQDDGSYLIS